jgi:hypothetical protein
MARLLGVQAGYGVGQLYLTSFYPINFESLLLRIFFVDPCTSHWLCPSGSGGFPDGARGNGGHEEGIIWIIRLLLLVVFEY